MKNLFTIFIILIIATGIGYVWTHSASETPQETVIQGAVADTLIRSQEEPLHFQPAPLDEEGPPPSLVEAAPSVETIRDEVEQNPHGTPPSITDFAMEIAPRMEAALQSESEATSLFEELKECTKRVDPTTPLSVKAICLSNANILKQSFPSLEDDFNSLFNSIPEELQKLIEVR